MTVNRGTDLARALGQTLARINSQIETVEHKAKSMGISAHDLTDANGSYQMIPLLAAKAQCLHSLVLVNQRHTPTEIRRGR